MTYSLQKLCIIKNWVHRMGDLSFLAFIYSRLDDRGDDKIMSSKMTASVSSEQLVQVQVQLFKVDPSVAITTSCSTGVTNEQKLDGQ